MNYNEIKQMWKWANAVGIRTLYQLYRYKTKVGARTNSELLDRLHESFVLGLYL